MTLHRSVCYKLSLILRIACILFRAVRDVWACHGVLCNCQQKQFTYVAETMCVIKWVFPLQVHFSLSTLIITSILFQQLSFHLKPFVCNSFRINMLIKTYYFLPSFDHQAKVALLCREADPLGPSSVVVLIKCIAGSIIN